MMFMCTLNGLNAQQKREGEDFREREWGVVVIAADLTAAYISPVDRIHPEDQITS